MRHAKSLHHFTECKQSEKWTGKHSFREHLMKTHTAIIGPWTEKLEDICYYETFSSLPKLEATADIARTAETPETTTTSEMKSTMLPSAADLLQSKTDSPLFELLGQTINTDAVAILGFINAFETIIAQTGGSTSKNLTQYIIYSRVAETTRAHIHMSSALAPHLNIPESSIMKLEAQDARKKIYDHLKSLESERDSYREACWREGYNIEELDRVSKTSERYDTVSDTSLDIHQEREPDQHMSWWDVLHHVSPQSWVTKKDRINFWLLQSLAAQPKEAHCHKKYLQDQGVSDQLSEEAWARLVLKFWTLDDAARPSEDADCSTNGAVDSDGACHSARVKLVGNLPVPEKLDVMDIDSESEASTDDLWPPRKRKRGEGN